MFASLLLKHGHDTFISELGDRSVALPSNSTAATLLATQAFAF